MYVTQAPNELQLSSLVSELQKVIVGENCKISTSLFLKPIGTEAFSILVHKLLILCKKVTCIIMGREFQPLCERYRMMSRRTWSSSTWFNETTSKYSRVSKHKKTLSALETLLISYTIHSPGGPFRVMSFRRAVIFDLRSDQKQSTANWHHLHTALKFQFDRFCFERKIERKCRCHQLSVCVQRIYNDKSRLPAACL